jgi:hypothetical protein
VVGRRGLEPRTSALIDLERSATESGTLHETAGVIGLGLWLASGDHDHHEEYSDYGNDDPEASHVGVSLTGARRHGIGLAVALVVRVFDAATFAEHRDFHRVEQRVQKLHAI